MPRGAAPAAALPPFYVYNESRLRDEPKNAFQNFSASVYGIDAYLVEVEVDVGSARMQDFSVVGLPDNAVKESREHQSPP
jgi:hypothetical protein